MPRNPAGPSLSWSQPQTQYVLSLEGARTEVRLPLSFLSQQMPREILPVQAITINFIINTKK